MEDILEELKQDWKDKIIYDETYYKIKKAVDKAYKAGQDKQKEELKKKIEWMKKKVIPNMLQEDEMFNEKGIDGVNGYNEALNQIIKELT